MAFAWLLSANRKAINWRVIIWGTLLQLILAFFKQERGRFYFIDRNK